MFSEVIAFTMRQIAETQKRGVVTCVVLLSPDAGLDQERPMRRSSTVVSIVPLNRSSTSITPETCIRSWRAL